MDLQEVGYIYDVKEVACSNASTVNCTNWDPANEVTYYSGPDVYVLDWAFVSNLIDDPEPLWGCDAARALLDAAGIEILDAVSGDLLYELGLRDGDIIVKLNNYDMLDYEDLSFAFATLWLTEGETDYTLEIDRDSNIIELNYQLSVSL